MSKKIIYFLVFLSTIFTVGCGSISHEQSARIAICSREANAHTAGQRIGNSAYWSCLERVENNHNAQKKRDQQMAELGNLKARCDSFGFKRDTQDHSQCMYNLQQQDIQNNFKAAQINQEQEKIRQQSLRDFNDAIKPPPFIPLSCPSGMMRNGKCV